MLERAGFPRPGHDLFRGCNRFLHLAISQMGAAFARLIDHFLGLGVCFRQDFGMMFLRLRELLFNLFSIAQALRDPIAPFV